MARLIQRDTSVGPRIFPLDSDRVTIGRNEENDIPVDNMLVSRLHATISRFKDNNFLIRDFSKNGTYVNGTVVKERMLKDQDIVRIGATQFIFDNRAIDTVAIAKEDSLAILQQVSKAINRVTDETDLMNLVLDLVFKVVNADKGMILLVDETSGELAPSVVRGIEREEGKIIVSRTIIDHVMDQKLGLIIADTKTDPRFSGHESIVNMGIESIMAVPLLIRDEVIGIIQIEPKQGKRFIREELDLLCAFSDYLATGIKQARMNEEIKQRSKLIANLERYHSPEVMNMIISDLEDKGDIGLNVEEKVASILFVDICKFTNLSEKLEPVEVALILNDFFSLMTDIVFHNAGTLDKYIGDSVMALFGVPYSPDKHADRAVKTGIEMQNAMKSFFAGKSGTPHFDIRVGINSGKVVAGNIGSQKRMEYSVIGDTVNTASRLCDICEPGKILIGGQTQEKLTQEFLLKSMGEVAIKGKEKGIVVFEVLEQGAGGGDKEAEP